MNMPLRAGRIDLGSELPVHGALCQCQAVVKPVAHVARKQCMVCATHHRAEYESVALAVIEHEQQLVLIQRTKAPLAGYWAPPAGHVEFGESVTHAAIREAREESGLAIKLEALEGVYTESSSEHKHSRMVISAYRSRSIGGVPVAGDDAGDIRLFRAGEIPYQPPPKGGSVTDYWVYEVIQALIAPWHRPPNPYLRLLKTVGDK